MNNLDANRRRGSLLFAQFRASAPQRAVVAATRAGNLEQVRELLNAGARVPPNAILLAAENDHGGILEALLDRHPAGLEFLTTPHALKQHVERGRIQVLLTVMRAAPGTDAIKTMAKETIVACDAALLSVMLIKVGHEPFLGGALDPLRRPDFYQKARAPTVMEFVWNFVRPHIQDPQNRLLMVTVAFRSRNPERFKEALRDLDPRWFTHETFRSVVVNAVEAYDPDRNTAYVDALRVHGVVATLDELSFKKNCRFDIFLKLLAFMDGPLDQYIMVYTPPKQPWSYIGDLLADLKEHAPELLKTWWIHHGRQVSRCLFGHEEVAFMMEAFPDARFPPEDQDLVEAATRGDADAVANLLVTHQEGSVLRAAVLAAARAGHVGVLSHLGQHTPMVLAVMHQDPPSVLRLWHIDALRFVLTTYGPDCLLRPEVWGRLRLSRKDLVSKLASTALWSDGDIRKAELFLEAYDANVFFPTLWSMDWHTCHTWMPSAAAVEFAWTRLQPDRLDRKCKLELLDVAMCVNHEERFVRLLDTIDRGHMFQDTLYHAARHPNPVYAQHLKRRGVTVNNADLRGAAEEDDPDLFVSLVERFDVSVVDFFLNNYVDEGFLSQVCNLRPSMCRRWASEHADVLPGWLLEELRMSQAF